MGTMERDRWAGWMLGRRDGDDAGVRERMAPQLAAFRDGVLNRAELTDSDVLLDVGTGDGLIGFGALDRLGPDGRVIFSDVSADLLATCLNRAERDGLLDRCRFLHAGADNLGDLADATVDVVTTRSVLIYVADRPAAFAEFARVLRPGGRLSIFEPINRFARSEIAGTLFDLDLTPVADLVEKLLPAYARGQDEGNPMLNFDERDLLRWAREAGFTELELDYRAEVAVPVPPPATSWDTMLRMAPNPLAPTLGEAMELALTVAERARLADHVQALLAAGTPGRRTLAVAFLRATRGASA